MFATRAHLSDQASLLHRTDINQIILQEIAKEESLAEAEATTLCGPTGACLCVVGGFRDQGSLVVGGFRDQGGKCLWPARCVRASG